VTKRGEGRQASRTVLRRLRRAWIAALAAGVIALVFAIVSHREAALLVLALGVAITGVRYLGRAMVHRRDPDHYRHGDIREQVCSDIRLGCAGIGIGAFLALLATVIDAPFAVSLLALPLVAGLHQRGRVAGHKMVKLEKLHEIGSGTDRVSSSEPVKLWEERSITAPNAIGAETVPRLVRRRTPPGQISFFLNRTLSLLVVIWACYASLAFAEVVHFAAPDLPPLPLFSPGSGAGAGPGGVPIQPEILDPPPPTYADLCPDLPDPLTIPHGLGELFRSVGGVYAGCGGPASQVAPATWISSGNCGDDLRSLAVAGEEHDAVLLFGAAAAFALVSAQAGTLRYAEAGEPSGGEVDVVATSDGNHVFIRSSARLRDLTEDPQGCTEVEEVPGAFVHLEPSLAQLWADHMGEGGGWLWPAATSSRTFTFSLFPGADPSASGECITELSCSFESVSGRSVLEGAGAVTVAGLGPLYPTRSPR
jgi:hypothetical protein